MIHQEQYTILQLGVFGTVWTSVSGSIKHNTAQESVYVSIQKPHTHPPLSEIIFLPLSLYASIYSSRPLLPLTGPLLHLFHPWHINFPYFFPLSAFTFSSLFLFPLFIYFPRHDIGRYSLLARGGAYVIINRYYSTYIGTPLLFVSQCITNNKTFLSGTIRSPVYGCKDTIRLQYLIIRQIIIPPRPLRTRVKTASLKFVPHKPCSSLKIWNFMEPTNHEAITGCNLTPNSLSFGGLLKIYQSLCTWSWFSLFDANKFPFQDVPYYTRFRSRNSHWTPPVHNKMFGNKLPLAPSGRSKIIFSDPNPTRSRYLF